jgi:hypothetical protein
VYKVCEPVGELMVIHLIAFPARLVFNVLDY